MLLTIGYPSVVLPSMRRLVVVIHCLTLGLLSAALLVIVEGTWQEPLNTPVDWAVFSVNSNPADESEFPDGTLIRLLCVRLFGKSAPEPKIRPVSLRSVRLPLSTQSHRSLHENLFRCEAVLRL